MGEWRSVQKRRLCAAGEGLPVIKIAELKDGNQFTKGAKWEQNATHGAGQIIDTRELGLFVFRKVQHTLARSVPLEVVVADYSNQHSFR